MIRLIYIILGLLLVSPVVAQEQTYLPKYKSKGWWHLMTKGGIIRTREDGKRTGAYYMGMRNGIGSLNSFDYVNGYAFGPEVMLGKVRHDGSRIEVDSDVKYAFAREAWIWRGAIRYYFPLNGVDNICAELFAQQHTDDYDSSPIMSFDQLQTASSLFGWNSFKLYNKEAVGLRLKVDSEMPGLSAEFKYWLERRSPLRNHRKRNVFRVQGEDNIPRLRGYDVADWQNSPLLNWQRESLMRFEVTMEYTPNQTLNAEDDMHCTVDRGNSPTWGFVLCAGSDAKWRAWFPGQQEKTDWRYVSLELTARQTYQIDRRRFQYFASVGTFFDSHRVGLPDMRHFDASHFCWQNRMESSLTWFSLLTNYELSTSKHWAEVHGEYLRRYNSFFAQYLQLHVLSVAEHSMHYEFSYGWHLSKELRIGLSAGWDGSHYDGLGFNLIITNNN